MPLNRRFLNISGADRYTFLQGLITQDIFLIDEQPAIYTAMLTTQGRYLYDFFVIKKNDVLIIDIDSQRFDDFRKHLSLYKLRSQVTLTDVSMDFYGGAYIGETTQLNPELLGFVYPDPRTPALGLRMIIPQSHAVTFTHTPSDYNRHRLLLGIPDGVTDMVAGKSIPLEFCFEQLNAISWTKGCYLGQELTARSKHVGVVRKSIFPAIFNGNLPLYGTKIYLKGQNEFCGETLSHHDNLMLCRLKIATVEECSEFIYDGGMLKIHYPH